MLRTDLCDILGIEYPIIQGGMAPWTTERLSVAVANAGALGVVSSIGVGMKMSPPVSVGDDAAWQQKSPYELLRVILQWVSRHTAEKKGIFGVNIPLAQEFGELVEGLIRAVNDSRREDQDIANRLKVIITSAGNPAPWGDRIKRSDVLWFHVVPSVDHARKAEQAGADLVIASGREGGGHVAFEPVHTMVLLPAVVKAVGLPVVGAGGFCDGATLAAALSMGAIGIQMGTRFIATQDSDFPEIWRQKILASDERGSHVGISVFGPARYLKNKASMTLHELLKRGFQEGYEEAVKLELRGMRLLPEGNDPDNSVFLGGEVAGRIDRMPSVDALLKEISADAERVIQGLSGFISGD
jgi:NAD(P)H-dependent flavin oxidoreductase YrpB (nitropropane dioxygenase family)